ncbi:MAG: tRNA (adenosine(37)-N6)-threonylcarbamoyltransferase complex ATPase subunit type 1 TsaE [Bacteroidales bacterium]
MPRNFPIRKSYWSNENIGDYGEIYHFDFYRIDKPSQAFDIGFEEYIYRGNYCFIEWGGEGKRHIAIFSFNNKLI